MIKITFGDVSIASELEKRDNNLYARIAQANELLLRGIRRLDDFAKPKSFTFHDARLLAFEQLPSDESHHMVRVSLPVCTPVDEIASYQIIGEIDKRVVNVVVEAIFHTYQENRTGSTEYFMNGKDMDYKPEFGGISVDEIWQDSRAYEQFTDRGRFIINTRTLK